MTASAAFKFIPLCDIDESTQNPRRHVDGPALAQLAESIRTVGVITPAIVRPVGQRFELAAGHRRYRAAKLAGLTQLPCIVRPMADQAFLEVLTIENLQREDVHPLDEATGYETLMAAPYKMKPDVIATRVGKSEKYIYDRVKLLALSKAAQQLFWNGKIEAGHAILLARLPQADQAKVIGSMPDHYRNGGLFRIEQLLYDEEAEGEDDNPPIKAVSVRELQDYIKRHIRFNAKQADGFLFPETVAQVAEAAQDKRKIIEITHEYLANDDVRRASADRVYGERAWKRADGKEGSKPCERSVLGVIASGPGQGEAFKVCTNKDRCEIHWGAEVKAKALRLKANSSGSGDSHQARYKKQNEERLAREAKEEAQREQWKAATPAILKAVAARVKVLPVKRAGLLVELVIKRLNDHRWSRQKSPVSVPCGPGPEDVIRHAAFLVLSDDISHAWSAPKKFPKLAKALGIDLAPLLKAAPTPLQTSAAIPDKKPAKKVAASKKRKAA